MRNSVGWSSGDTHRPNTESNILSTIVLCWRAAPEAGAEGDSPGRGFARYQDRSRYRCDMASTAPVLSSACVGWATTARFTVESEDGVTVLRPEDRSRFSYEIRPRDGLRVELFEVDPEGPEDSALFAVNVDVLEHYLVSVLADDIRDDLDLSYLDFPWDAASLNRRFTLSDMRNGYRTLRRIDGSPVAAARDETISLAKLVPLSQFLTIDLATLKRAFLNPEGAPLLVDGRYQDQTPPFAKPKMHQRHC